MGPTSLANVARSLGDVDADEAKLLADTGKCRFFGRCFGGLTLDDQADIARAKLPRAKVTVVRDVSLDAFRAQIARANDAHVRISANYARGVLYGEGGGHHSPVAGYLADGDLALILDVDAAVGPVLVPVERLYAAVESVDGSTGKKRGLVVIEAP
jgi:hypothetical protein